MGTQSRRGLHDGRRRPEAGLRARTASLDVVIARDVRASAKWGLRRLAASIEAEEENGEGAERTHRELARADIERFLTQREKPPQPDETARLPRALSSALSSLVEGRAFCFFPTPTPHLPRRFSMTDLVFIC